MRLGPPLVVSTTFLVVTVALGLSFGSDPFSVVTAIRDPSSLDFDAIVTARLPRVVLGALAGGGLAAVGVAFQAVLRNPLAEPYVLGVSGGAALGATLAILAGLAGATWLGASLVPAAALAGGMGATVLVYSLVRLGGDGRGASILLAGVVVNAIASAAITFLKTLVSATQVQMLTYWLMGFVEVQAWHQIALTALYVAVGVAVLLVDAGRLNLLALGDDAAGHLGVDVRALEQRTFFACSAVVGAIVSLTGLIGFVGLVVPHALRRLLGPDVRVLLPTSLLAGAGVLVLCDLLSRVLFRWLHTTPPVGAVTALIGGPLFLVLLGRRPFRV